MKKILLISALIFFFLVPILFLPEKTIAADTAGGLESSSDCNQLNGWTGDPDNPNLSIDVHFYADGQWLGATTANLSRGTTGNKAICEALGGGQNCNICSSDDNKSLCKHAFYFTDLSRLNDGNTHQIMAYGINIDANGNPTGDNRPINNGVPQTITCADNRPPPSPKNPSVNYQMIEQNAGVGAYNQSSGGFYFQANTSWNSNLPKLVSDGTYLYALISMGDQATSKRGEQGLEIRRKRLNSSEDFVTIWSKPNGLYRVVSGIATDKHNRLHVFYYLSTGYLQHEIASSPQANPVSFSLDTAQPINQHCGNCRLGVMYDYSSDSLYIVSDQIINADVWAASYVAAYRNGVWTNAEKIMDWPWVDDAHSGAQVYIYSKLIIFNGKLHIFFSFHQYNSSDLKWFKSISHYYKNLGTSNWNSEIIKDSTIPNLEQTMADDAFITSDGKLAVLGHYNRCPSGNCWDGTGIVQTHEYISATGVGGWEERIISPNNNYVGICVQKTSDRLYHMMKVRPYDKIEYAQSTNGTDWTEYPITNTNSIFSLIGANCLEENGIPLDKAYASIDGLVSTQPRDLSNGHTVIAGEISLSSQPTPLPGDLDHDNDVDIFDYNLLVGNFGKTGTAGWIPADINADGKVDIFDYNILVGNFGL